MYPRDRSIIAAVKAGHSQAGQAAKFDLSRQRVSAIVAKAKHDESERIRLGPAADLPLRVRNILLSVGIPRNLPVASIRRAYAEGLLDDVQGLGKGGAAELRRWLQARDEQGSK